jgi:hypothetical protein
MLLEGFTQNKKHRSLIMNALMRKKQAEIFKVKSFFELLKIQYVKDEVKQEMFKNAHEDLKKYIDISLGLVTKETISKDLKQFSDTELETAAKTALQLLKKATGDIHDDNSSNVSPGV